MKKYNENNYEPMLKNNYLTDLIITKNGKKKGVGDNSSVYRITSDFLRPYGINLWGCWVGLDGWELRQTTLDKNFPLENFPILVQMYGFTNADIYICLERNSMCEYGFYFNTETLKIRLVEYRWGEIKKDCFFNSFAEFWAERKNCKKKYEKMLPKEDK